MGGLLVLFFLTAVVLAGASAPSTPVPERTGPFHWHVVWGGKKKHFMEPTGRTIDGYPELKCPFPGCDTLYVIRS
jgi:hypothetical protein